MAKSPLFDALLAGKEGTAEAAAATAAAYEAIAVAIASGETFGEIATDIVAAMMNRPTATILPLVKTVVRVTGKGGARKVSVGRGQFANWTADELGRAGRPTRRMTDATFSSTAERARQRAADRRKAADPSREVAKVNSSLEGLLNALRGTHARPDMSLVSEILRGQALMEEVKQLAADALEQRVCIAEPAA